MRGSWGSLRRSLLVASLLGSAASAQELRPLGPPAGAPVDWIAEHRNGLRVGRGDASVAGMGLRLLAARGGRVTLHNGAGTMLRDLTPDDAPHGASKVAAVSDLVVLAEDGRGVRLFAFEGGHHGAPRLTPLGTIERASEFTALATGPERVYVATAAARLIEIDTVSLSITREYSLERPARALAAAGERFWLLDERGLELAERHGERLRKLDRVRVEGTALQVVGRSAAVGGPGGVQWVRLTGGGPVEHDVSVGNNFFSPVTVAIDPEDTVTWTHSAFGGLHNVESCTPTINGCGGVAANETFTSGPVAGPPWVYSYTFTEPGANPYVCISHLPFMVGSVQSGDAGRFRVPINAIELR